MLGLGASECIVTALLSQVAFLYWLLVVSSCEVDRVTTREISETMDLLLQDYGFFGQYRVERTEDDLCPIVWAALTKYLGAYQPQALSPHDSGNWSPGSRSWHIPCLVRLLLGSQTHLLTVSSPEEGKGFWGLLYEDTDPITWAAPTWPDHLPLLHLLTPSLGVGFNT